MALLSLATAGLVGAQSPASEVESYAALDPAKVAGVERCGECHVHEIQVWKRTRHETGFDTMHRTTTAEQIAERMGFRLIKRDSLCIRCHYTPEVDDGQVRARSGVSCESCHGAGKPWIEVHNDYGDAEKRSEETAEHRRLRIERSRELGMRRPSDIYGVAANCFSCHTVPEERLVNVGGHSTGSASFELVAWTQGKIRHNWLGSQTGGPAENRPSPPPRRRLLYVTGRALDLEYSLRGMAVATEPGIYAKAMSRRVRAATAELRAIADTAGVPEVRAMLETLRDVRVVPGNRQALVAAADRLGEETRAFLAAHDGTRLAVLDPLVAGEAPARVAQEEDVSGSEGVTGGPSGASEADDGARGGQASMPAKVATDVASRGGIPAEGEARRSIHPRSSHPTLGPGACSGCHAEQNRWWFGDPHFAAADRFLERGPKAVRIARLYGLDPSEIARGNRLCMDCHGTVVTGKESRETLDGVGCEACHGSAGDYLEPHKEGDPALGDRRPGYAAGFANGMRRLADLDVRLRACASCHYVTDRRLLSSGHGSGADFDVVAGMARTRHWKGTDAPAAVQQAWQAVLAERGPVPSVRLARLPDDAPGSVPVAATGVTPSGGERPARPVAFRARPLTGGGERGTAASRPIEGLEIPAATGARDGTLEDELLALSERIDALYRALGQGGGG